MQDVKPGTRPRLTIDQICEALEKYNGMVTLAAAALGVSRWAIYKRSKKNPRITKTINMSREELIDIAESKLRIAIMNGEPWAIALTLRTVGKGRGYVERVENTGVDGQAMQTNVSLYLPDNNRDNQPKQLKEPDGDTITAETRDI